MKNITLSTQAKMINFVLILSFGLLIFFFGGYWGVPSSGIKLLIRLFLSVFTLGICLKLRRNNPQSDNWKLFFALFLAAFAFFFTSLLDSPLQALIGADTNSLAGLAKLKLVDTLLILFPIFLVTRAAKIPWKDLYLTGGQVGLSLLIGGIGFTIFAVVFFLQVRELPDIFARTTNWLPWVLLFVFANATMEEIHFRGLLLKPSATFLGKPLANLCITIFFTLVHAPVQYTSDIFIFLAELFFLSLLWGWLAQKTESIWGSVLFHAGADLMIMAGIVQTYVGR
ncbi:MAG: CPBP family intramembrane glutamic endopeptidase [Anaerolineaceae bacterium]